MPNLQTLNCGDLTPELRPLTHQAGGGAQESLLFLHHEATHSLATHDGPHRSLTFLGIYCANLGLLGVVIADDVCLSLLVYDIKLLEDLLFS